MERFTDQALVLSTVDYGEADRMVTLLTLGHGKLTAFAAGARKSKRRFAGALEPFTLVKAHLAERRGTTYRLDSVDIERGFYSVREDLPRIARALYCVELCRELVRDHEPHPQLFEQLVAYLDLLERKAAGPTSLLAFELSALALAGLMPRFDSCAVCGNALGESVRFDPDHGGAVCHRCTARSQFGIPVLSRVVQALAGLQAGERQPLPADIRARARELLNHFIAHHLGRKLNSVDFMLQVGTD
jgi:DNA repair protein RecO (recombination protein O)